jgi:hypothetical protein
MSLSYNIINGIVEVKGVYQGQGDNAIQIGRKEDAGWYGNLFNQQNPGPNLVTITPNRDSVTMRAFYDQTKSDKPLKNIPISYIQMGSFTVNGIPFPICAYDSAANYPIFRENQLRWLDMPDFGSLDKKTIIPFFPYWILANNQNYPIEELSKHPQLYGGICKNNDIIEQSDYLCATMEHTIDIGLGLFPSNINVAAYYDGLTDDELVSEGVLAAPLTQQNLKQENIERFCEIFIKRNYTQYPIAGSCQVAWPPSNLGIIFTGTRLFIRYQTHYLDGSKYVEEIVNVLIYPEAGDNLQFAYLDQTDVEEFEEDIRQNGSINIDTIRYNLFKNWNKYIFLGPFTRKIQLGYNYHVFACNYNLRTVDNKYIMDLKLLEGFQYNVWREFDESTNKWSYVNYNVQTCSEFHKADVYNAIEELAKDRGYILVKH